MGPVIRHIALVLPLLSATSLAAQTVAPASQAEMKQNPWLTLMTKAAAHAAAHGAPVPLLSPLDRTVAPTAFGLPPGAALVPVQQLQAMGVRVEPWTTNDPAAMRAVIGTGVNGLISDRPDLLQGVVAEMRAGKPGDSRPGDSRPGDSQPGDSRLEHFTVSAHRGGRGLRPENTLPSFESGLDQLASELETDTGVSTDGVSLIWHDQFYNPASCRRADGKPYTMDNRVYLRDISSTAAAKMFVCDKLHFGPDQRNDLALSPVAVAFAAQEGMASPYAPTYVTQLFRFVAFYAEFYSTGAGRGMPGAAERAANARTVHFNIETKIVPDYVPASAAERPEFKAHPELIKNHTVDPQLFVTTLAGAITGAGMAARCDIQSFDFRTLQLVEEQFPAILTVYLTEDPRILSTPFVPAALRVEAQ